MVEQKPMINPFDLRDKRAMISLGPLVSRTDPKKPVKHCSYNCPFCYVHGDYLSFASMSINEIVAWLKSVRDKFDIIYISGDTDSFAPPRMDEGMKLLVEACEFDVDIMFTTRAVLTTNHLDTLRQLRERLAIRGKYLFGCTSVIQLFQPDQEPKPICPPEERIEQLRQFKILGLVSVLAMRPFLPVVPVEEYLEIVDRCKDFVDIVLGKDWFADKAGVLERGVFKNVSTGNLPYTEIKISEEKMDFDDNESSWKVYRIEEIEKRVGTLCDSLKIPFYMRSRPAVEDVRKKGVREYHLERKAARTAHST